MRAVAGEQMWRLAGLAENTDNQTVPLLTTISLSAYPPALSFKHLTIITTTHLVPFKPSLTPFL